MKDKLYYTVSEVSKDVGVSQSKIRFWDEEYNISTKRRETTNARMIKGDELKMFHKIKLLTRFLNSTGVKAVLSKDLVIQVNPQLLEEK